MNIQRIVLATRCKASHIGIFAVVAFAALVAGCATTPTLTPITDPAERLQFPGFSVLPPQGKNWYIINPAELDASPIWFARQIDPTVPLSVTEAQPHTIRAVVRWSGLGSRSFNSPHEFLGFVRDSDEKNTPASRFRVLEYDHTLTDQVQGYCVRADALLEDRGVPGSPGSVFYMRTHDLTCLHPRRPGLLIRIGYSQRASSKDDLIELSREGEPFLQSIRFTSSH